MGAEAIGSLEREKQMKSFLKTSVIDDITAEGIDARLQNSLLDLFENAMKAISATVACEARFVTTDFASAKQRECEGFDLHMRRLGADTPGVWEGRFTRGDQHLTVLGHLE